MTKKVVLILLVLVSTCLSTVSSYNKITYTGDGSTVDFPFTFEVFSTDEVVVTLRTVATGAEEVLTETTDYSVTLTGSGPATGGTVTTVSTYTSAYTITISRSADQTQETDLQTGGALAGEDLEDAYDKLAMQIQDLQEQVSRCLRVPITDGSTVEAGTELANSIDRASSYLTFDASGVPSATAATISGTTASTFGASLIDDADADTALATLGISSWLINNFVDAVDQSAAQTALGLSSLSLLDEDDMASDDDTKAPTQQSVKAYVDSGTVTMSNKTLASPSFSGTVGTAIAMGSNKITGLADGTASGDALNAGQVDGTTIQLDGSNDLEVKDAGITNAKLADGAALTPDSGADTTPYGTKLLDGGTSPMGTSWANFDLSGSVGAQKILVFLKLVNNTGGVRRIKFRPNGCTEDIGNTGAWTEESGGNVNLSVGEAGFVVMLTDASGIVEYVCDTAASDIDVFLMGYIR